MTVHVKTFKIILSVCILISYAFFISGCKGKKETIKTPETNIQSNIMKTEDEIPIVKEKELVQQPHIWKNVEIVGGGFVPGIIFSNKQKGLMYARTDIGGAYRWDADAQRWIPLLDFFGSVDWYLYGIESLAIDSIDSNRVYLAAGMYVRENVGNGAILRSSDYGKTWQRTDMPFKMGGNENGRSIGERLAIDPNDNSILYFGSRTAGLWKSIDYAVTWNKVDSFPVTGEPNGVGIGFIIFDEKSGTLEKPTPVIYVGVAADGVNLYRSIDGGIVWEEIPGQPEGFIPHHGVLASNDVLYLTYGNGPGPNGMTDGAVWKCDTTKDVWTNITPIVPGSVNDNGDTEIFGYSGLTVDASNPDIVIVSTMDRWNPGDDIFRSIDGGVTWKSLGSLSIRDSSVSPYLTFGRESVELGHWVGDVEIDPFDSNHVIYVTGATIWGSNDIANVDSNQNVHWTVQARGLEEIAVNDLISPPVGAHLISGMRDLGGFRHDDINISPRDGMFLNPFWNQLDSLDFAQENPLFIVRVGSARHVEAKHGAYSLDGGTTWAEFQSEPEEFQSGPSDNYRGGNIAISADGSMFVWSSNRKPSYYSQDRGKTWEKCSGLPEKIIVISDRVNPEKFYAFDSEQGKLYISTDRAINFTVKTENLPQGSGWETGRLKISAYSEGDLWIATYKNGLYHSTDLGENFTKLENVQEAYTVGFGKAAPQQNYPAIYMAGKVFDIIGLFRSDDMGNNWVRINDDRHQYGWTGRVVIGDPRIYGRVYIATNGRGILYADPIDVLKEGNIIEVPETISIPVIDGKADDACWQNVDWQNIDNVWMPYGAVVDPKDFSGRYKITYSSKENLLYFLVEVIDEVAVDGYMQGNIAEVYNFDMLEVFIDENKSGGLHVFDGTGDTGRDWGINAENAFSYHVYAKFPKEGEVTKDFIALDIAGQGWDSRKDSSYAFHFPQFALTKKDNLYTREFSLKVYNDTYNETNPEASRVQLEAGKSMGFSLAYCDNDDANEEPKTRDNFFGSVWVPQEANNDHWKNADYFGTIKLIPASNSLK